MKTWVKVAIGIAVPTVIVGGYLGVRYLMNRQETKSDFDRFLELLNKHDDWKLTPSEYKAAFKKFQKALKNTGLYNVDTILAITAKPESAWTANEKRMMQLFLTDVFSDIRSTSTAPDTSVTRVIEGATTGANGPSVGYAPHQPRELTADEKNAVIKSFVQATTILLPYTVASATSKADAKNLLTSINSKYFITPIGDGTYNVTLRG